MEIYLENNKGRKTLELFERLDSLERQVLDIKETNMRMGQLN